MRIGSADIETCHLPPARGEVLEYPSYAHAWLICRLDAAGALAFNVRSTFTELLECDSGALAIAIDIPIGLTEDGAPRVCDVAARQLLEERASSF